MKGQIWKWLSIAGVLMGLATMSPAPIKDPQSAKHEIGQHSAQQRLQDLRLNGKVDVVGTVPAKTNQDGTGVDPIAGDSTAKNVVAAAPLESDRRAVETLALATKQLEEQKQASRSPWMVGLWIFLGCFGAFQGLKYWLEKNGPAPRARSSRSSKVVALADDEPWS